MNQMENQKKNKVQSSLVMVAIFALTVGLGFCPPLLAQVTGGDAPPPDSVMIFTPAVPLLTDYLAISNAKNGFGLDLLFSASGWGAGAFIHRKIASNTTLFLNTGISGRRNTDEFENVWLGQIPVVAGKVNRLFMIPTTVGVQYRLFSGTLQESFRPYVSAGVTPTYILSTPYIRGGQYYEFFNSFGYGTSYLRVGAAFGVGAMFGDPASGSLVGVQLRYYTIPFGGDGLESMKGSPIKNFGGVFITLSVGSSY
ncbi:MAG: hypothetical protein HQ472_09255 [Ignavibacteria bacterium]|nr:hypothetical protein [Ignavibacteria bacterium]